MKMSTGKCLPLTKEEVLHLVDLVQANPVLFTKTTNAANNQLKDATWRNITSSFNTEIAITPRKPEQLRLKWENLKKAARKRSSRIKMNIKTEDGKLEYIPPDETLDKVTDILSQTCDDYSVYVPPAPKQTPKFIFSSAKNKEKSESKNISDAVKESIIKKNEAIAQYYDSKRKREEEMFSLKKKREELQIREWERNVS